MSVRVLTLNVWNLDGEPARQQRLRDGIRALQPDLLALQEVARTADVDQLASLVDGLGLHSVHQFDLAPPAGRRGTHGIALASR
jgi:endonuclease/exonuclease/phosphatase family metal-dependent hydrolase